MHGIDQYKADSTSNTAVAEPYLFRLEEEAKYSDEMITDLNALCDQHARIEGNEISEPQAALRLRRAFRTNLIISEVRASAIDGFLTDAE